MGGLITGSPEVQDVSHRIAAPAATLTALKGIRRRRDGMVATVLADGSRWIFRQSSALTGDDILVVTPTRGSGRWLRAHGSAVLELPFTFATADAAVLLTVPAGCLLALKELFWKITTTCSGGSSSAIGVSSSKTSYTTKGDLLGGAAGDVAAALTTALSPNAGTVGAGFDTLAKRRPLWKPTETILFDRITSVFTAGAGSVLVNVDIVKHDGA